jgi:hypothetical protein
MQVDKDVVEVTCREWSDRRVRLAKTRLLPCLPPAVASFTVVEFDDGRLLIQRGNDRHVDTILDAFIENQEEAEEVRDWIMLIQYPDELDVLINTLTRKYRR